MSGSDIEDNTNQTLGQRVSLVHSAFHALKWRYAGTAVQAGLQLFIGVVLARLLSPEAFGIVGMALIAVGLGRLVGDLGFGAALIQHPNLTPMHVRAAFTGSVVMGTLLFICLWLGAPSISAVFDQAELTPILRVIGLSLVVSGLSVISTCLMRRKMQFQLLTVIETVSYLLGFGAVGISMAFLDYGVWSLVAANIVQPLCLFAFAVYFGNQPIWPTFRIQEYREISRVASAEMMNNLVNFTAENLHFFVTGKWLGAAALGLFNRSYHLMHLPVKHFSFALWSVTFPVYATIQGDIPRLARAFLHTVALTSLVTMPVFFTLAVAPQVVVGGLFGEQWKSASATLQILCIGGPFMAMLRVFGAMSHARGYVFSECGRQLIYLALVGVCLWFLFPYGLEGLAVAVTIAVIARYLLLAHLSIKLADVSWRQFFIVQLPGCLFGIAVAVPVYVASTIGEIFLLPDFLRLVMITAVAAMTLAVSCVFFPSSWLGDLYPFLLERFGPALPHWLRKLALAKLPVPQCAAVGNKLEMET